TDQAAQHVAAALVAGTHAVADQHQRAAHVVADDAQVDVVLLVRAVAAAGELLRLLDDGEDLVDLVHVLLALQQVGEALDAEAGTARELGEDEVPALEIAVLGALVAGRLGQAAGGGVGAVLRAAVLAEGQIFGYAVALLDRVGRAALQVLLKVGVVDAGQDAP